MVPRSSNGSTLGVQGSSVNSAVGPGGENCGSTSFFSSFFSLPPSIALRQHWRVRPGECRSTRVPRICCAGPRTYGTSPFFLAFSLLGVVGILVYVSARMSHERLAAHPKNRISHGRGSILQVAACRISALFLERLWGQHVMWYRPLWRPSARRQNYPTTHD